MRTLQDAGGRSTREHIGEHPGKGWARAGLVGLLSFGAISALGGAVFAVAANGAGVPLSYLEGTPFASYLIPGLILGIVIGGTQGLAAITALRHHRHGPLAASVAGFGMIIWIFVELAITGYSWLQAVYIGVGIAEVALVLLLLGVLPSAEVDETAGVVAVAVGSRHGRTP